MKAPQVFFHHNCVIIKFHDYEKASDNYGLVSHNCELLFKNRILNFFKKAAETQI